jgi:predicted nucleic acid-binding protein
LVDTNILFSALLFPNSIPARALLHIAHRNTCVLCDWTIAEFRRITAAKRPDLCADAEELLLSLPTEIVVAPQMPSPLIADPKDAPILNAAILAEVEYIISGDKHFLQLQMEQPKVLTAAEYLRRFLAED